MTDLNVEDAFDAIEKGFSKLNAADAFVALLTANIYFFIRYVNPGTIDSAWDDMGVLVKKGARDPSLAFNLNSGETKGNA